MAITDNLIFKVKAESGQSVITDSINAITFSGGGTATLVNDGTYGNIWRITGGALSATLSGHGFGNWTETGSKTTTLAARFRVTSRASNYTRFIQIGTDANNGIFFGNAGSSTGSMRDGVCIAGSSVSSPAVTTYTTGDVITLVMTFTETNSASDPIYAWKGTTGRSGTTADATSTVTVSTATRAIAAAVLTVATETLDLIDLAYWNRGLSDAEASAVADDIRGQLYTSSSAQITAVTGNSVFSGGAYVSPLSQVTATTANASASLVSSGGAASSTITANTANAVFSGASVGSTSNGVITSDPLKSPVGLLLNSLTVEKVFVIPMSATPTFANVTTDSTGHLVVSGPTITPGSDYLLISCNGDGSAVGVQKYTAA